MKEPVKILTIEQAVAVMDSISASPALPSTLWDWQKEALSFIKEYINASTCQHEFLSGPLMTICKKCKGTFPNKQTL
jgi:hypothetical protein